MQYQLKVENLQMPVYLGWPDQERQELQVVVINITLSFKGLPKAGISDELDDTLCYAKLSDEIVATLEKQSYKLLEHLGLRCYDIIKKHAQSAHKFHLSITKFLGPEQGARTFELFSE